MVQCCTLLSEFYQVKWSPFSHIFINENLDISMLHQIFQSPTFISVSSEMMERYNNWIASAIRFQSPSCSHLHTAIYGVAIWGDTWYQGSICGHPAIHVRPCHRRHWAIHLCTPGMKDLLHKTLSTQVMPTSKSPWHDEWNSVLFMMLTEGDPLDSYQVKGNSTKSTREQVWSMA